MRKSVQVRIVNTAGRGKRLQDIVPFRHLDQAEGLRGTPWGELIFGKEMLVVNNPSCLVL